MTNDGHHRTLDVVNYKADVSGVLCSPLPTAFGESFVLHSPLLTHGWAGP